MKTRILIVDDNEAIRKALTALLETHANWEVCGQARNGKEGVAKATELKPDLIVLDLVMPVMDGFQTARAIAKVLPAAPILLHTQHYSPEIELEAKKFGVRQVVAKSHPAEKLFQALESLLSAGVAIPPEDSAVASGLTAATIAESATIDTQLPAKQSQTTEGSAFSDPAINGQAMDGSKPD
jgi:NarL family two-component system response regulator LiaR